MASSRLGRRIWLTPWSKIRRCRRCAWTVRSIFAIFFWKGHMLAQSLPNISHRWIPNKVLCKDVWKSRNWVAVNWWNSSYRWHENDFFSFFPPVCQISFGCWARLHANNSERISGLDWQANLRQIQMLNFFFAINGHPFLLLYFRQQHSYCWSPTLCRSTDAKH